MKQYNISYKNDEVYQAILINAENEATATAYFKQHTPTAEVLGCDEATADHQRPGKPCLTVPEDFNAEPETEPAEPFPHLAEEIRTEYETRRNDAAFYVENGFFPSWAEEYCTDPDRGLKQYSTPAKWEAYKGGTLSREKAIEIATRRALKEVTANEEKQFRKLRTAANAPRLEWCQIAVEWVRSSTWGYNPHATATAQNMTTQGRASGCGYDKRSTAVAEALNANPAALRVLYEAAEKALSDGHRPERYSNGNYTWRDILGYGSGYSILPYFEGGVGVSCFWDILSRCGFEYRLGTSTRNFDSYTIRREEE